MLQVKFVLTLIQYSTQFDSKFFWFPALITLLIEGKRNSGLTSFYLQQRPPTPSPGFFSAPFPLVPLSRATPAIFSGASQTFHVLPYLDGRTLRFNHFLTKVYQMLKKGLFHLGPSAKIIWKVKMSPVKPIVLRLKVLGEGEHCSRELKQKRNKIGTSFLLQAAAVSRFLNQPAVRNYIASAL